MYTKKNTRTQFISIFNTLYINFKLFLTKIIHYVSCITQFDNCYFKWPLVDSRHNRQNN